MAAQDAREQGRQAGLNAGERKSPFDGRTENGKAWYEGYDLGAQERERENDAERQRAEAGASQADETQATEDERTAEATSDERAETKTDDAREKTVDEDEESDDGRELAPAGAATDPDVHYLIAQRQSHQLHLEAAEQADDTRAGSRKAIAEIDRQLRKMGYSV
jgi:hypothetical protein